MLTFTTPTELPIEAAVTMGVSVKEDGSIGRFGTGMKYALAGVLRLGGGVSVQVGDVTYEFEAVPTPIRDREFYVIRCNGASCGFTTELGKHWEPWQLFRELASNALDEGGTWTREGHVPQGSVTVIQVSCREIEAAEREEQVFLGDDRALLLESRGGATVYAGACPHYYFRGIRAGSFSGTAPVTVNVHDGSLSEDRKLDQHVVQSELAWAFRTATRFDESLMLSVLSAEDEGDFWVQNVSRSTLVNADLPRDLMDFIEERPKWVKHPAFKALLKRKRKEKNKGRWAEVEITERHLSLIREAESVCEAAGVDSLPRENIHFTNEMGDNELAATMMDTRHVWFSTKLVMKGRDEFVAGYLEEALHAMTGCRDGSREMQNTLFSIIVSMADDRERRGS